ncbi:SRPBCC family protein [Gordonia sp. FQ]|uniref:SRPBCC family protein n=1 Tax=Gordonia sp. FQ TaxID=3446634 RepID=UPI003F87F6B0
MFDAERDPAVVELGIFVTGAPEIAWRALTEPDSIARWLAPTIGFAPAVGTTFIVQVPVPGKPAAEMSCQVVAADEQRQLTYSWTDLRGEPLLRWLVDWQLRPQGRGTRVLLHMSGFDVTDRRQKMARNAVERGWNNTVLPKLAAEIDALGAGSTE